MTPVFKKDDKSDKSNYRPKSILFSLSKVYEQIMQNQIYPYLDKIFKLSVWPWERVQCRTLFNCDDWKWRQPLDSGGQPAVVLTDLSKAFDCIDHELLITKLNAYGFDNSSLSLIYSYLFERKQRTKINSSFSYWAEIVFGIWWTPRFNLGNTFFNAYICDLFFEVRDLEYATFADDTTPYSCLPKMITILEKREKVVQSMSDWW